MKKILTVCFMFVVFIGMTGCFEPDTDTKEKYKQEQLLQEGAAQAGLPAITRFTDKKLLKMILEKRDQANLQTWTYLVAEQTGKLVFLGRSMGYGVPAATQYTNPMKYYMNGATLPQADPNGLFSPASAEGTWIMMLNPNGKGTEPVYIEPRIIVSPFPLQ